MSQKTTKNPASAEEVAEMKLKNAFKLIKEERYGAARHILSQMPEHPKALKMLAYIEGQVEKPKAPPAISGWGLFIVIFVVLAVGGAIGAALFVENFMEQFTLDELATMGIGPDDGEYASYSTLIRYCDFHMNNQPNKCLQWPIEVYTDYPETLEACFAPHAGNAVLDGSMIEAIDNCLAGYNVPAPY